MNTNTDGVKLDRFIVDDDAVEIRTLTVPKHSGSNVRVRCTCTPIRNTCGAVVGWP